MELELKLEYSVQAYGSFDEKISVSYQITDLGSAHTSLTDCGACPIQSRSIYLPLDDFDSSSD